MGKITVFLAEDHAVVREGLAELIRRESDMEVVWRSRGRRRRCSSCETAQARYRLMDIAMPIINGVEATKQIKASVPQHAFWF